MFSFPGNTRLCRKGYTCLRNKQEAKVCLFLFLEFLINLDLVLKQQPKKKADSPLTPLIPSLAEA